MISKIKKEIKVMLVLDEEEAMWLKGIVQNPIGCKPDNESDKDNDMRQAFWDALNKVKTE